MPERLQQKHLSLNKMYVIARIRLDKTMLTRIVRICPRMCCGNSEICRAENVSMFRIALQLMKYFTLRVARVATANWYMC